MGGVLGYLLQTLLESVDKQISLQIWGQFSELFTSPLPVLTDPLVQKLQSVAAAIAMGALPVVIGYHVLRRTLDTMAGESTVPPEVLLRRCFVSGATVTGISLYAWFAATLAERLREVVGSFHPSWQIIQMFFGIGDSPGLLTTAFFLLVFLAAAGAVCLQRAILAAEFTLLLAVGAFLGLTRAADEHSLAWQTWKRELASILITPLLQLLILFIFSERLVGMSASQQHAWLDGINRWVESGAMLYLLWNTPRWARQFTYSTGVAHGIAGAATEVGRFAAMRYMVQAAAKGA